MLGYFKVKLSAFLLFNLYILSLLTACPGSSGPGGGATGLTGGGGGPQPVQFSSALDGPMGAKSDWEGLETCRGLYGELRARYQLGYSEILDRETSKASPPPFQMTTSRQAPFMVEGRTIKNTAGEWGDWEILERFFARMVIFRGGTMLYQDVPIHFERLEGAPNALFTAVPSEVVVGDIFYLFVFQEEKIISEKFGDTVAEICSTEKPPGFSPAPEWKPMTGGQYTTFSNHAHAHFLGAMKVEGFSLAPEAFAGKEAPFSSDYRLLYGAGITTPLDANPKSPSTAWAGPEGGNLKLMLQHYFSTDPGDINKREWIPYPGSGPTVRMVHIPASATGFGDYKIYDWVLDGMVREDPSGKYNVLFSGLALNASDRLVFHLFHKIDTVNSDATTTRFEAAPALVDENSYQEFLKDPETSPLGSLLVNP